MKKALLTVVLGTLSVTAQAEQHSDNEIFHPIAEHVSLYAGLSYQIPKSDFSYSSGEDTYKVSDFENSSNFYVGGKLRLTQNGYFMAEYQKAKFKYNVTFDDKSKGGEDDASIFRFGYDHRFNFERLGLFTGAGVSFRSVKLKDSLTNYPSMQPAYDDVTAFIKLEGEYLIDNNLFVTTGIIYDFKQTLDAATNIRLGVRYNF